MVREGFELIKPEGAYRVSEKRSIFENASFIINGHVSGLLVEMFYLNTIEQLFLLVEQLDQLEVCLPYSRLLAGISILAVFQNLRWNSNKTSLIEFKTSCLLFLPLY